MKNCFLSLMLGAVATVTFSNLQAQVPQIINYQGRVVVGTTNFNGTGQFRFALVNANGSTTYWSNDGTSVAGSQPTNAVSVAVSKGLYSVLLGDTSIPNMSVSVPASVFNNTDVRLRVWFNDGTTGSQLLSPDQRIASVGYAAMAANIVDSAITSAKIANGAVGTAQIANASIGSSQIASNAVGSTQIASGAVGSAQIANNAVSSSQIASGAVGTAQIASSAVTSAKIDTTTVQQRVTGTAPAGSFVTGINQNGTVASAASGSSIWSLNGTTAFYNGGNVGIGQNSATYRLEITEPSGFDLALFGPSPILKFTDTSASNAVTAIRAFAGGLTISNNAGSTLADFENSGNVGIGTSTPLTALEVRTTTGNVGITHSDGTIRVGTYVGGSSSGATGGWLGTISNNSLFFFTNNGQPAMSVTADGRVHIDPVATVASPQFEVAGGAGVAEGTVTSSANRAILSLNSTISGNNRVWTVESGLFGTAGLFGIYDRTAGKARLTIDSAGTVSVPVLSITGGADVAEPFPIADKIDKGAVVVIDAEHPGRLKRSTRAYDRKVAGIVSGANGIQPGIALHQDGALDGGENVALSGRVYVQAETSNGFIEPGDLLTTSDVPGHAMKVTDHARAQGAVIGKAMSSLRGNRGTVLVLVTLQ